MRYEARLVAVAEGEDKGFAERGDRGLANGSSLSFVGETAGVGRVWEEEEREVGGGCCRVEVFASRERV